ncbi:MAG: hypothetical protein AAFY42_14445, partial [Pseudomonadota bacterium]
MSKLETGVIEIDPGQTDLAALTQRIVRQLAQVLEQRQSGIDLSFETGADYTAKVDADSAESLLWRLLASLGGACDAEERLKARLTQAGASLNLTSDLPKQMRASAANRSSSAR